MNKEFYFTPYLTESEHYIVSDEIETYCKKNDLTVAYYRQFKSGHVPLYRECKVIGAQVELNKFKYWLENDLKVPIQNLNRKL